MSATTTKPATVEDVIDVWGNVLTLYHGVKGAHRVGEGLLADDHPSMVLLRSLGDALGDVLDADGAANRPTRGAIA